MAQVQQPTDPVDALVHDHGRLSALLLDLRATKDRVDSGDLSWTDALPELEHAAALLRDSLVEHFAKEEEALFPFIESRLDALRARCESVRGDHGVVCSKIDALVNACAARKADAVGARLDDFERAYATHSQKELELLREVAASLDDVARARLRTLMDGL